MNRPEETRKRVPKVDVSIGGIFLPRGVATPLIVLVENAQELRQSGVVSGLFEGADATVRSAA